MKKGYKGYKSYQYLEKDVDYKSFELAEEVNRVKSYDMDLTKKQQAVFNDIVSENLIIDLHEHPTIIPKDLNKLRDYEQQGREVTGYESLSNSITDVIFDNMMDGTCIIHSKSGWKFKDIIHDIGMRTCDIDHQDFLIKGEKIKDFYQAKKEDKIAWVKVLESATMIENEVERIEILYGLGVRMMGITYSESNNLGSGLKEKNDGGLTEFGEQAVKRMNKVGMAIDVSHCGNQTALDVIEKSEQPIFISHIGAKSLWNINRLKPDKVFKACAAKGGVIGIEAAPHTTITENNPYHNLDSYMEHFEYIKDLVGIDHLAFGPDALFGDHVGLHDLFSANFSIDKKTQKHKKVDFVDGLENPAEVMENILKWLIKNDYSKEEIKKVMGGNIVRVLKEVWV
ncbi:MAG TPA: membrane dipeptidase [Halanaerobiales bacterium]|nr:membrane dipeptidase [Halanaerobiales bacterium]